MGNEIIKAAGSQLPTTPTQMNITASGEGTAIGVVNGGITINASNDFTALFLRAAGQQPPTSHIAEWASLNQERFNVFVLENEKYSCGVFSIGRKIALTKHTSKEYKDHFNSLTDSIIHELLDMPCLFAIKNQDYMTAFNGCPAFLGRLTQIQCQEETIRFEFKSFKTFNQKLINDNIQRFHLSLSTVRNQLDVEHWSIRNGNLIQIAADMGIIIE